MKISSFFASTTIAISLAFSGLAMADQTRSVAEAKKIIKSYKDLRASCAKISGEQRMDCFAQLNDANEEYVAAKQYIRQTSPEATDENDTAAHRVTFL